MEEDIFVGKRVNYELYHKSNKKICTTRIFFINLRCKTKKSLITIRILSVVKTFGEGATSALSYYKEIFTYGMDSLDIG